jgi:recombinational DNA repair protein (RecF pathway)
MRMVGEPVARRRRAPVAPAACGIGVLHLVAAAACCCSASGVGPCARDALGRRADGGPPDHVFRRDACRSLADQRARRDEPAPAVRGRQGSLAVPAPAETRTRVILRSVDVASRIASCTCSCPSTAGHRRREGRARSAKRFAGTLDLFNHLRVSLHRGAARRSGRLEQAVLVHHYAPLRSDPARFALGCYLLELLDRLAPEGGVRRDMQRLFRFALDSFAAIAAHRPDPALRTILELRALDALGLRPELRAASAAAASSPASRRGLPRRRRRPVCGACAVRRTGVLPVHRRHAARARPRARARRRQLDRLILSARATREARRSWAASSASTSASSCAASAFLDRMLARKLPPAPYNARPPMTTSNRRSAAASSGWKTSSRCARAAASSSRPARSMAGSTASGTTGRSAPS